MYPSRTQLPGLLPQPVLAGVVGGVCFLGVAVLVSVLAACLTNRRRAARRRRKRLRQGRPPRPRPRGPRLPPQPRPPEVAPRLPRRAGASCLSALVCPQRGGFAGGCWVRLCAWGSGGPEVCRCHLWFCPNRCASYLFPAREVSSAVSPSTSSASFGLPSAPAVLASLVVPWGGRGGAGQKLEGGEGGSAEVPAWGCPLLAVRLSATPPPRGSWCLFAVPSSALFTKPLKAGPGKGPGPLPQSRIPCPSPALLRVRAVLTAWQS